MKEYNYKESIEITEKALDLLNVKRFLNITENKVLCRKFRR